MMKRILAFFKKETVLCVSLILAVVSMFIVPPDKNYWEYIDFRTLAILFCLMSVMAGLQKAGMFITNDVALITFVPKRNAAPVAAII